MNSSPHLLLLPRHFRSCVARHAAAEMGDGATSGRRSQIEKTRTSERIVTCEMATALSGSWLFYLSRVCVLQRLRIGQEQTHGWHDQAGSSLKVAREGGVQLPNTTEPLSTAFVVPAMTRPSDWE
jgi:hypothetical protein